MSLGYKVIIQERRWFSSPSSHARWHIWACTPGRGELHGAMQPRLYIETELPTRRKLTRPRQQHAHVTWQRYSTAANGKEHPTVMQAPRVEKKNNCTNPGITWSRELTMRKRENGRAKKTKERSETTCCMIRTRLRYRNWANEEEKCRYCCSSARMTKGLIHAVLAPD